MIDRIVDQIKRNGKASAYRISEKRKSGLEWYFVRTALDSSRAVETTLYTVALYADSGEGESRTRGECTILINPGSDDEEIRGAIDRAVDTAAGMKNPWYPLPGKSTEKPLAMESAFFSMSLGEAMEKVRAALYAPDGLAGATINSLEIFLSRMDWRTITSAGVDVSWTGFVGFSEFVVNAGIRGKNEVELYADIHFSDLDGQRLSAATKKQLAAANDRLAAESLPACENLPLLLSGELAAEVFAYWFENVQASAVYDKVANFALGGSVSMEGSTGDSINMRAVPMLKGSPNGGPYDPAGFLLKPIDIIENNIVKQLVAPVKYAHYLGCEPSGALSLFELAPGSRSQADLRLQDHLEVVTFSDFFVDATTGNFGGEIRLGYLVKSGRRTAVRGGSVTGTMLDNRGRILLSSELETGPSAKAPAVCVIPVVSITAASSN